MFHPSRISDVENQIKYDLRHIDMVGSVKIYLCFYDEYMVSKQDWKGVYPSSKENVSLYELIELVRNNVNRPFIIRHNVMISPIPVGIHHISEDQSELEKYIEVCLVY
jgi:hypothetical protein